MSLTIANSSISESYLGFWHVQLFGLTIEHWVNDGLMAIFFLLIGLELKREIHSGELSDIRNALLPIVAAVGGVLVPAIIHFALNRGMTSQAGIGIPMATDIAFALGILAIVGSGVPTSLKVFITALAVIDDLIAIAVIALFYSADLSLPYLAASLSVFTFLFFMNRKWRISFLTPYLIGGVLMWFLMLKSGVHATVAGILLAFAIPFANAPREAFSPSRRLERFLHKPTAFGILPLFALVNTGVVIGAGAAQELLTNNSIGIIGGLIFGKPLGIVFFCFVAVLIGATKLPPDLNWKHIFGAGLLAGIGFTMSIFITNLAYNNQTGLINTSKLAILFASLCAGGLGYVWLSLTAEAISKDKLRLYSRP